MLTQRRILAILVCGLLRSNLSAVGFQPKCPMPFNEAATRQPFDNQCAEGKTKDTGTIAQDLVKDDFCRSGPPVVVTFGTLKQLQKDVDSPAILGPQYGPPTDRRKLQHMPTVAPSGTTLGEGVLARLVAFILEAHYSDVSSGESVNCKLSGSSNNDIHVALVEAAGESDECRSVTAEITPHYRPAVWTDTNLNSLKGTPVRVTGQLLFDASHHPCTAGKRINPLRQSSWEIHPLYTLEVCSKGALAECRADDETAGLWVPLSQRFSAAIPAASSPPKVGPETAPLQVQTVLTRVRDKQTDGSSIELIRDGTIRTIAVDPALSNETKNLQAGDLVEVTLAGAEPNRQAIVGLKRPVYEPDIGRLALALAISAVLLVLLTRLLLGSRSTGVLILGVDGRYSNSKFQVCLWFGVLMLAYIAALILRGTGSSGALIGGVDIPTNLLVLSGISALSFAGAKAITTSKGADAPTKLGPNAPVGRQAAAPAPGAGVAAVVPGRRDPAQATKQASFPGDLVNDDFGVLSFARFQIIVIVAIAVVVFLIRAVGFLRHIPLTGTASLPDVDTTLLTAFGLGQGAYLANKLASPES